MNWTYFRVAIISGKFVSTLTNMCEFYSYDCDDLQNLQPNKIDLYCRWLYQTEHADGKPRMLQFLRKDVDSAPISHFIDRIKQVKALCLVSIALEATYERIENY
jgi:hypothetical protein